MAGRGAGRRLYPCAIRIRIKIKGNVSNDTVLRVFSERSEHSLRERSELS